MALEVDVRDGMWHSGWVRLLYEIKDFGSRLETIVESLATTENGERL